MLRHVSCHNQSRYESAHLNSFVETIVLQKINLRPVLKNRPKVRNMHSFQYTMISCIKSQLCFITNFEGISRSRMVDIMRKTSDEHIKPLFLINTFP